MRRKEREITDFEKIVSIIDRTDTVRIGINGDRYPYVVPVSFGYEIEKGSLVIYFHGAADGKKYDLLKNNPYVFIEGDRFLRYAETAHGITALYESFMAEGECSVLSGKRADAALKAILTHCGFPDYAFSERERNAAAVYMIKILRLSAKANYED